MGRFDEQMSGFDDPEVIAETTWEMLKRDYSPAVVEALIRKVKETARMPLQAPEKPAGELSGGESYLPSSTDKIR